MTLWTKCVLVATALFFGGIVLLIVIQSQGTNASYSGSIKEDLT